MEIIPGVHQLKVPNASSPVHYVLPYVFEVSGGLAIIDPGWNAEESVDSLRMQLAEVGAGFSDLKQVIVTHVHPDHYGMAGLIREESGAEIVAHEADLGLLFDRPSPDVTRAWYRSHGMEPVEVPQPPGATSVAPPSPFAATRPDRFMHDGDVLHLGSVSLQVVWTPGHAPGHCCFYDAEQELLFSGDHVLPRISPNVSARPGVDDDPMGDYLASLAKLKGFRVRMVYPAHEYSFEDLGTRLDELTRHHEERAVEILAVLAEGPSTAHEVARRITWSVGRFDSFDAFTKRLALGETIAHLNRLVREKRLKVEETDGAFVYSSV